MASLQKIILFTVLGLALVSCGGGGGGEGTILELLSKVVSDKLIMRLPCRPRSPRFHL